jgi:hypothetical protein
MYQIVQRLYYVIELEASVEPKHICNTKANRNRSSISFFLCVCGVGGGGGVAEEYSTICTVLPNESLLVRPSEAI